MTATFPTSARAAQPHAINEPTAVSITSGVVNVSDQMEWAAAHGLNPVPASSVVHWTDVVHSADELLTSLIDARSSEVGCSSVSLDRHPEDLYLSDIDALRANYSRAGFSVALGIRKTRQH